MNAIAESACRKLSPRRWNTSPFMRALLGWMTGDHITSPEIAALVATSDGHVMCMEKGDIGYNRILCGIEDFERNFTNLFDLAGLTPEEREWAALKVIHVVEQQEVYTENYNAFSNI